jgi:CheY-like chemotaxis protein
MPTYQRPAVILVADDDVEDRDMVRDALATARVVNPVHFVRDGEELMDYLRRRGKYVTPVSAPRPGLILLDLKMPRKDGFEALQEIRSEPSLCAIPVVALTTSNAEEDVLRAYSLGVNSFVVKPASFEQLVRVMKTLGAYWFETVELPDGRNGK